jgi:DNA repair exonuclease SbcCD ATPase subunit
MRLIRLILNPFAGSINKCYYFERGINVIYGHNEAGKSTIMNALLLVLLTRTDLQQRDFNQIKRYIPIGGDTINIELNFEVNGTEYELKKSWGFNKSSSLSILGEAAINDPNNVQEKLFELLNLNQATVREIIFTTQAKIASTIEGISKDAEITNSLDQILREAILNTGGINPASLEQNLKTKFDSIANNWVLGNDQPLIGADNRGSYQNRRLRNVGEILKIAYDLFDKEKELENRLAFDKDYSSNANDLNEIKEKIKTDDQYISENKVIADSLINRDKTERKLNEIQNKFESLQGISKDWNEINGKVPAMTDTLNINKARFENIKQELDNARLSQDAPSKLNRFEQIQRLKTQLEDAKFKLADVKEIKDEAISPLKLIHEELENAKNILYGLESAQNFLVEIKSWKNIEVEIKQTDKEVEKLNLLQEQVFSLEVNKGFIISTSELTIEVKSLTDQIQTITGQISDWNNQINELLANYGVENYDHLLDLNKKYNDAINSWNDAKKSFENAILGDNFEALMQEANILGNLPKTRDANVLQQEYDELNLTIGNDSNSIINFNEKIKTYENNYESLENIEEKKTELILNKREANLEFNDLPNLPEGFNIEEFKERELRLTRNRDISHQLEVRKARLEATQPEKITSELLDEIELLKRKKNQKVEEAKALKKVLDKLADIMMRGTDKPYQPFANKLCEYLIRLSGGKYEISDNGMMTPVEIKKIDSNLSIPINMLSQGTSGILGLALRLAMADYFLDGYGFLAFDDPMVDFDQNRQVYAAACLNEYSMEKQVLIFTCHYSHAEQLGGKLINLN